MSMHIEGPHLTTTGKKKGKKTFRNSAAANKARRDAESWKALLEKYDVKPGKMVVGKSKPVRKNSGQNLDRTKSNWRDNVEPNRLTDHIPSVDSRAGVASKAESKQYTGDECIGVAVMHKSCLQPIFSQQSAKDAARMRRG